jgi:hypothetical protein
MPGRDEAQARRKREPDLFELRSSAPRDRVGDVAGDDIAISLAIAAGLTAVFAPMTARLYRRKA